MWDLKLLIISSFLYLNYILYNFFFFLCNLLNPFISNGFILFSLKSSYWFPLNMTFFFSIKFTLCIALLILIRGGTPRYRYDYLTKLGWLKFLGLIILIFFISMLFFFLF